MGKTTNTVHLAAALGHAGYRVLVIDLDPAAGATKHLGLPTTSYPGSLELLTSDEHVEERPLVSSVLARLQPIGRWAACLGILPRTVGRASAR